HLVKKKNDILIVIKWHLPPTAWIKINFDGYVINSQASIGFFIQNNDGHVLLAGANNIGKNSINVVESVALQDGLDDAIDRGWGQIVVEGDSKLVIDSVLKKVIFPWSIQQIIQDIWHLNSSIASVRFQHVFREVNFTASWAMGSHR
ncbi:hypothetical protein PRUPE_6G185900, partial [Prunus persica]